jgi:hypothetical protein
MEMMQICFDKLSKFIFQCVDFGLVHIEGGGRGKIIFSKYGMKDKWPPIKLLVCVFSNKKTHHWNFSHIKICTVMKTIYQFAVI